MANLIARQSLRHMLDARPARLPTLLVRRASTKSPKGPAGKPKPIPARVLPQPDKFRPPSHSAQRSRPKAYPGPPLSADQRQQQATRYYPNMMPPKDTLTHYLLTSRNFHMYLTLFILTSLAITTLITDFIYRTPFKADLPPNSLFFSHPWQFLVRYWDIYFLHTETASAADLAKYEAKADDVEKRMAYREAHGYSKEISAYWFWTGQKEPRDEEYAASRKRELIEAQREKDAREREEAGIPGKGEYVDFTGERRKVKKWLGIW